MRTSPCDQFALCGVSWVITSRHIATASGNKSGLRPPEPADIGDGLPLVKQLFRGAQLAEQLLGVVAFAFHGASPGQVWPAGKLS